MNGKLGLIVAGLIALLAVVIVWFVVSAPITVEFRLVPAGSPDPYDVNDRLTAIGSWAFRAALVAVPAVGGFFFFRELLRQRAHDRRRPPN